MAGPPPKKNRNGRAPLTKAYVDVEVLPAVVDEAQLPEPPEGLTPELVAEWSALWSQPLAAAIASSDLFALRRLFTLRARQQRYFEQADADPLNAIYGTGLSKGSQDQLVMHPAVKAALSMESAIVALEDRFGMSLKSRQNVGIQMAQAHEAAEKARRAGGPQEEKPQRADPRLTDA